MSKFTDRFAINDVSGAFVLKADACCHRFDMPRNDIENTKKDDWLAQGTFGTREYRNEMRMIAIAYQILSKGIPKPTTEDLEAWIARHTQEA